MIPRIPKEDVERTMMFMRASQPVVDALNDQGVYGAMHLKEIDPRDEIMRNNVANLMASNNIAYGGQNVRDAFKELMYQRYRDMMEQGYGI